MQDPINILLLMLLKLTKKKSYYKEIYCKLFPLWPLYKLQGTTYTVCCYLCRQGTSVASVNVFSDYQIEFSIRVWNSALFLSSTPLPQLNVSFLPISNLLIHADFSFFFPHLPPSRALFSSTTSASYPRPSLSFLSVPCQHLRLDLIVSRLQSREGDLQEWKRARRGLSSQWHGAQRTSSGHVKTNRTHVRHLTCLWGLFADALSFQVACQKVFVVTIL